MINNLKIDHLIVKNVIFKYFIINLLFDSFVLYSSPLSYIIVLKAGQEKMSKVASAGPAVSSAPVAAATTATASKAADKPAAKEKTPEPSEEEGADGLLDFF